MTKNTTTQPTDKQLEKDTLILIEIIVRKCMTKDEKPREFNSYKAVQKDGKLIDCRFRRDVQEAGMLPTENCLIAVRRGDFNIDRNRKFPCVWIAKVEEILKPDYDSDNGDLPF